jgi:hypothetical protein
VPDVTPIATAPSSAALRPRRPPSAASAAAIPNHSRELLAAFDNRRSGSSREGVGVSATAAYVARSTAPSSRSAVAHADAVSRWPSRRCATASAMLRRGLGGSDDIRRILGRPGYRFRSVRASRRRGAIAAFCGAGRSNRESTLEAAAPVVDFDDDVYGVSGTPAMLPVALFAEFMIDCEQERTMRTVLVGSLREREWW